MEHRKPTEEELFDMAELFKVFGDSTRIRILYEMFDRECSVSELSEALGMSRAQTYWYIIIPQTVRRLIPLSINLITRMIKTTSLVLMIGVVEVIKVAQQIIEANRTASPNAAFGIYLTVFVLYFFVCWPISLLASYLEKKWK